jgi:hypothetical protein
MTATLESGGVVLDRVTREISADEWSDRVEVSFVATEAALGPRSPEGPGPQTRPGPTGLTELRVVADAGDTASRAEVTFALDTGADRWDVLALDARPSWMATFVRRALESDPRFAVTSRVVTSRGAASAAGSPPLSLRAPGALQPHHIAVIGAPEELTEADVAALERFMRDEGGAVLIVMDRTPEHAVPFQRLAGIRAWREQLVAEPTGRPLASEWALASDPPLWIEPYAGAIAHTDTTAPMWSVPVGRGRLLVSGVLDAWRFRDRDDAAFDGFWRTLVAELASGARQEPDAVPQEPRPVGLQPDERDLIEVWTSAHRGEMLPESRLGDLGPALARAIQPPAAPRRVHPMRSSWWMLPFSLLLGVEWWQRRRSGLR